VYVIHDVYGDQEKNEEGEEQECVVCLTNTRDTLILPCRHICVCHECATELNKNGQACPICRGGIHHC
jgi:E3 ubiquitin-protein ligase MGRN1